MPCIICHVLNHTSTAKRCVTSTCASCYTQQVAKKPGGATCDSHGTYSIRSWGGGMVQRWPCLMANLQCTLKM